ncbi:PHD finger protein 14 [Oopsacas minuta]|uniref:PHD finger protein 14 n=1 Tax=Oopsacas minuta TaxID=111878 RepID=A0AAV7JD33_9METZ|nr:PHD finger protein 14 [Oopsacas minuta]
MVQPQTHDQIGLRLNRSTLYGFTLPRNFLDEQDIDYEWTPSKKRYKSKLINKSYSNSIKVSDKSHKQDEYNSNILSQKHSHQIERKETNLNSPRHSKFNSFICMVCLIEEDLNVLTQLTCGLCGITVHMHCYLEYSDVHHGNTKSWFCEPCSAGVKSPQCELCPKNDVIPIKRTTNGMWAHLVCSRYTQAIYPGNEQTYYDLDRLKGSLWGQRVCILCLDSINKWIGVCCKCHAGLCKNYCHATCAQQAGLLYLAQDMQPLTQDMEKEEANPFYYYCTLHSIKELRKTRLNTWHKAIDRTRARIPLCFLSPLWNDNYPLKVEKKLINTNSPFSKVERFLQFSPSSSKLFRKKLQNYS